MISTVQEKTIMLIAENFTLVFDRKPLEGKTNQGILFITAQGMQELI
jgi:hypothetical protein